ncbi:YdcF family protein [Dellaglioa carnosa]|uniref:YdcF family protein n=1 Tax=Dellaglioa carnosa TaxID=2995136 RepID=UPI0022A8C868|nr:YdcF family protein [Dellaglioa carnosa]MCZ2493469.1 YdcF family protein [Dellaglioa carnosa]
MSYLILLLPFLILLSWYISFHTEPRRLLNGFLFNAFLISLMGALAGISNSFVETVALIVITVGVLGVFLISISTIPFLLINARMVFKRESHSLANMLGLILAIVLIVQWFTKSLVPTWPWYVQIPFAFASWLGIYFMLAFLNFLSASILYNLRRPTYDQNYIIVLGAGLLNGHKVSRLLSNRIQRAIKFADKQVSLGGKQPILVFSGGQGHDEATSEALAMQKWAIENGYPEASTLLEDKSTTTFENMLFSKKIIDLDNGGTNILFSSNNYHIFRAGLFARMVGVNAQGIGGKTAWYFLPNAFLREFIAILMLNKTRHLVVILLLLLVSIAQQLLN